MTLATTMFPVGIGLAALILGDSMLGGSQMSKTAATDCDIESLGRVMTVDTSRLRRVDREGVLTGSTEGGSLTLYYLGDTLRVIVARYMGESGRAVATYYMQDSLSFVVDRQEFDFDRPILVGGGKIVSHVRQYAYFCNGQELLDDHTRMARNAKSQLEGFAPHLRSKRD